MHPDGAVPDSVGTQRAVFNHAAGSS